MPKGLTCHADSSAASGEAIRPKLTWASRRVPRRGRVVKGFGSRSCRTGGPAKREGANMMC